MLREWKTEWMKVRYRGIGLLLMAFIGMTVLWIMWTVHDAPDPELWDGYRMSFLQIPIMDTILMPTMIAMLASRLCDAEVKGNTLKMLCTMQPRGRLFDMKFLMGAVYLAFFTAAQILILLGIGHVYSYGRPLEPRHLLYFLAEIYLVSLGIYLLQQVLSFFFENQIIPLAVGLLGSFLGLFLWFFPETPRILKLLSIWGGYSLLCFINMDWNEETRIITYYDVPINVAALCGVFALLVAGYAAGKLLFMRKEI